VARFVFLPNQPVFIRSVVAANPLAVEAGWFDGKGREQVAPPSTAPKGDLDSQLTAGIHLPVRS
jgi:hypothetical protein